MSKDISRILEGWHHEPDQVSVRIVQGEDGTEKIQLRLDLGLLQMEMHGRPDGQRPEGCDSWLDYYRQKQQEHAEENPDSAPFLLDQEDCGNLLREGVQYYHRYISFWNLGRYDLCARDTERNLRLFAFVRDHAGRNQDKLQFDQWRPYVTLMHTRSLVTPLLEQKKYKHALQLLEDGIMSIRRFLADYDQTDRADQCSELVHLQKWRTEIEDRADGEHEGETPLPRISNLREKLDAAVAEERFEEAAALRDQIERLTAPESDEPV